MRLSAVHSTSVARTVSLDIKEHSGRSAMGVTSADRRNGTVGDGRVMSDRARPQSSPLQKRRRASAASRQHPKTETDHAQPVRRAQPIRRQRQRQRDHGGARDFEAECAWLMTVANRKTVSGFLHVSWRTAGDVAHHVTDLIGLIMPGCGGLDVRLPEPVS